MKDHGALGKTMAPNQVHNEWGRLIILAGGEYLPDDRLDKQQQKQKQKRGCDVGS